MARMSPSRRGVGAFIATVAVVAAGAVVAPLPVRAGSVNAPRTPLRTSPPAVLTRGNADSPQQPAVSGPQRRGAYVAPLAARDIRSASQPGAATRPSDIFGFAQAGEVSSGSWSSDVQLNILTTLAYFGVPMNANGTLDTTTNGYFATWQGAQMTSLMQAAHKSGDRVVLTITAMSGGIIGGITGSESTRQAAIGSIIHQLQTRGGDGVNIDFEGGNSTQAANLTTFMSELRSAMNSQTPAQTYLTIDSYASAAMYSELYNIPALAPYVDAFDIMDYDVTSPSSSHAGPVSPLNASPYSTVNVVNSYLADVPATKIILGVPYYGYKWSTTDTTAPTPSNPNTGPGPNAATNGSAGADTYSGVYDDFSCADNVNQEFDTTTDEPWATWWSPSTNDPCGGNHGAWRELYWENAQSLSDKYSQVVNADELRGIGIWALGYDSGHGELWNLIATSLRGYPLTPSAPQSPAVSSSSPGSATVTWQTPRFPAGNQYPMTGYTVTPYSEWGVAGSAQHVSGTTMTATFTSLPDAQPVYFTVSATDAYGSGPAVQSYSVTPPAAATPPAGNEAVTTPAQQLPLPNSDGSTWQVLGGTSLSRTWTAASAGTALITVTTDLWSSRQGTNADIGVEVDGSLAAWKEAGFTGAFTPVPATLQTVVPVSSGSHTVQVVWKSNQPAVGVTIVAGAGASGAYSPSRLLIQPGPTGGSNNAGGASVATGPSVQDQLEQPIDGSTWRTLDRSLTFAVTPTQTGTWLLSGNADLWTGTAGINQDLGIVVDGQLVAWKESGGSAAFSPKATFVTVEVTLTGGSQHSVALVWKTNRAAPGALIVAGAGSTGAFSPSRLTAMPDTPLRAAAVTTSQPSAPNTAPGTWSVVSPALTLTIPDGTNQAVPLAASLDAWTSAAPANLDVGIEVDGTLVAWTEVGLTRAYSPCAVFVGATWQPATGSHTVQVVWRVSSAAAGSRFAGAGSAPSYSLSELLAG